MTSCDITGPHKLKVLNTPLSQGYDTMTFGKIILIEVETKQASFCKRHFQRDFHEWKYIDFDWILLKFIPKVPVLSSSTIHVLCGKKKMYLDTKFTELFPNLQLTIVSIFVRWWLGAGQNITHYLNQYCFYKVTSNKKYPSDLSFQVNCLSYLPTLQMHANKDDIVLQDIHWTDIYCHT